MSFLDFIFKRNRKQSDQDLNADIARLLFRELPGLIEHLDNMIKASSDKKSDKPPQQQNRSSETPQFSAAPHNPDEIMPPVMKCLDFAPVQMRANPALAVRLFHGNLCNFNCPYCFTNAPSTLNGASIKKVLSADPHRDELLTAEEKWQALKYMQSEFGTQTVIINGKGEPLLEPDTPELIDNICDLGMHTLLVSNGSLLKPELLKRWENAPVSFMVKRNAINNDAAENALFGLPEKSRAGDAIRELTNPDNKLTEKYRAERRFAINCVLSKDTADSAPQILEFCRDNGFIPWFDRLLEDGRCTGNYAAANRLSPAEFAKVARSLSEMDKKYGYDYNMTADMNLGCPPELNNRFVQITNHGKLNAITKFGLATDCGLIKKCINCNALANSEDFDDFRYYQCRTRENEVREAFGMQRYR
ncbi:MAG: radical SAM protein [Rickettsiales bacterium]|jgi:MoaA/NifB/PqqE/SkfB family radical SAM enzyme|nr:radical SAM protein [Rickettsiales bacterium]